MRGKFRSMAISMILIVPYELDVDANQMDDRFRVIIAVSTFQQL